MSLKKLLSVLLSIPVLLSAQSEDVHILNLPCSPIFTMGCPDATIIEDGLYMESIGDGNLKVKFELVDGKRQGEVLVLNESGNVFAKGVFHNNELRDNQLIVFIGGESIKISLDHDPPLWFFNKHVLCQSGVNQVKDGDNYVWLAGQRFRLEDGVEFAFE